MVREEQMIRNFEKVRSSGVTNMFNMGLVMRLAGISSEEYVSCMYNYDKLIKKYQNILED